MAIGQFTVSAESFIKLIRLLLRNFRWWTILCEIWMEISSSIWGKYENIVHIFFISLFSRILFLLNKPQITYRTETAINLMRIPHFVTHNITNCNICCAAHHGSAVRIKYANYIHNINIRLRWTKSILMYICILSFSANWKMWDFFFYVHIIQWKMLSYRQIQYSRIDDYQLFACTVYSFTLVSSHIKFRFISVVRAPTKWN